MSRDEWLSSTVELVTHTLPLHRTDALRKALHSVQREGAANAEAETRTPISSSSLTTRSTTPAAVFGALDSAAVAKKTSVVVSQQQQQQQPAVTTVNAPTANVTTTNPTRRLL